MHPIFLSIKIIIKQLVRFTFMLKTTNLIFYFITFFLMLHILIRRCVPSKIILPDHDRPSHSISLFLSLSLRLYFSLHIRGRRMIDGDAKL